MTSRNELYLAYLKGDDVTLPDKPLSRNEQYLAKLCELTTDLPVKVLSRIETYLAFLCGEEVDLPEKPLSETEIYFAALCGEEVELPEKPLSRIGSLLASIIESGGFTSEFSVTYYDEDGVTVLATETVSKGGSATQAPTPTKEDSAQYTYTFAGWAATVGGAVDSTILTEIESDISVYAVFTASRLPQFRSLISMTLKSYEDEAGITTLNQYQFSYDTVLEEIRMPSVTAIPGNCLNMCTALKKAVFPVARSVSAVTSFGGCTALEELRIPNCASNLSVILQNSMVENLRILDTKSGSWNLNMATAAKSLQYVILRKTTQITSGVTPAFHADSPIAKGNGMILVPKDLVNTYKAAAGWSDYADYIFSIEEHESEVI